MILSIRTDKPEAEVGLFNVSGKQLEYETWQAHRELSATIHKKIDELLVLQGFKLQDLTGIVFYKGPGSFTGLRIGASIANAFSYGLNIPAVGLNGEEWVDEGLKQLKTAKSGLTVIPEYGSVVHITKPKK